MNNSIKKTLNIYFASIAILFFPALSFAASPTLEQIHALGQNDPLNSKNCKNQSPDLTKIGETLAAWGKKGGNYKSVANAIEVGLADPENVGRYKYMYICDQSGELRAMVKYNIFPYPQHGMNLTFIEDVIADPDQKGGGTAAIKQLVKESLLAKVDTIRLRAIESAKEFYEKLGFKKIIDPERGERYSMSSEEMIRKYFPESLDSASPSNLQPCSDSGEANLSHSIEQLLNANQDVALSIEGKQQLSYSENDAEIQLSNLAAHVKNPFVLPDFYEILQKNPKYLNKLFQRWYELSDEKVELFAKTFKKFFPLLIDPGIMSRQNEFLAFIESHSEKLRGIELAEVREHFSKFLGPVHVYRGLVLTPEEAQLIQENGMLSPGYLKAKTGTELNEMYSNLFKPEFQSHDKIPNYPSSPLGAIRSRLFMGQSHSNGQGNPDHWTMISVTEFPEVAKSIGYYFSRQLDVNGNLIHPNKKMYLFSITLPQLSVIYQQPEGPFKINHPSKTPYVKIGDSFLEKMDDPKVEMFVPFFISKEAIKKVEIQTQIPIKPKALHPETMKEINSDN